MNFGADCIENRIFDEININDSASLTRKLTHRDIELFAVMSGDVNPALVDSEFAKSDMFHKVILDGTALVMDPTEKIKRPRVEHSDVAAAAALGGLMSWCSPVESASTRRPCGNTSAGAPDGSASIWMRAPSGAGRNVSAALTARLRCM